MNGLYSSHIFSSQILNDILYIMEIACLYCIQCKLRAVSCIKNNAVYSKALFTYSASKKACYFVICIHLFVYCLSSLPISFDQHRHLSNCILDVVSERTSTLLASIKCISSVKQWCQNKNTTPPSSVALCMACIFWREDDFSLESKYYGGHDQINKLPYNRVVQINA